MRIVIPDAHSPAALSLIREFGRAGHEVWAVCEGGKRPLGLKSKYVSRGIHLSPKLSRPDIRESFLNILHDSSVKPIFMPLSRGNIEMVSKHRQHFDLQCWTLVPAQDALLNTNDKRRLYKIAEDLGIAAPPSIKFFDNESVGDFAYRQPFPVVLKYYDGERLFLPPQRRYTVAKPGREIYKRYSTMHDVQNPVLVQEYIKGESYGVGLVLDVYSNPVSVICSKRIREYPRTGGPGTRVDSVWDQDIAMAAAKVTSALGLKGLAYAEFKKTDGGQITLLDVSARAWHSLPLAGLAGLALGQAYMWASMSGTPPKRSVKPRYALGVKMKYPLADLRSGLSNLMGGRPDLFFGSVADCFNPAVRNALWDREDWKALVRQYDLRQ